MQSDLSEYHTVRTDTEKARDANVEVTAGFENSWAVAELDDVLREGSVSMMVGLPPFHFPNLGRVLPCLLYTSDAADE